MSLTISTVPDIAQIAGRLARGYADSEAAAVDALAAFREGEARDWLAPYVAVTRGRGELVVTATGMTTAGDASPFRTTCTTTDASAERRTYECQVPVFSVRPEGDRLVRFEVVADADGGWEATRTGVVTFR